MFRIRGHQIYICENRVILEVRAFGVENNQLSRVSADRREFGKLMEKQARLKQPTNSLEFGGTGPSCVREVGELLVLL